MPEIDIGTVQKAVSLMQQMLQESDQHSIKTYDFQPFQAKNSSSKIGAIDGSHHNIQGTHFVFSSIRSGYQIYQDGHLTEEDISRTKIEILTKSNFRERHEEYFYNITGDKPQGMMEFDKSAERIRTLLEWDKVKRLVEDLSDGDVIIFDGSMISGVISTNKLFFEELETKAKEKGITLAGLSKDTSLMIGNTSVPRVLSKAAERQCPDSDWFVPYEDTYFVKFKDDTDFIFRLDLVLPEKYQAIDVIEKIAAYCYDPAIQGFPFPMQTIHDAVRISEQQVHECLDYFKEQCVENSIPLHFVDELFKIYHDQLDKISYGR